MRFGIICQHNQTHKVLLSGGNVGSLLISLGCLLESCELTCQHCKAAKMGCRKRHLNLNHIFVSCLSYNSFVYIVFVYLYSTDSSSTQSRVILAAHLFNCTDCKELISLPRVARFQQIFKPNCR